MIDAHESQFSERGVISLICPDSLNAFTQDAVTATSTKRIEWESSSQARAALGSNEIMRVIVARDLLRDYQA